MPTSTEAMSAPRSLASERETFSHTPAAHTLRNVPYRWPVKYNP